LKREEGILLLNEISQDDALDGDMIEDIVTRACHSAKEQGIKGQALTPFLLTALAEETSGESLDANIALLLGNARLAARASSALAHDA
ncbi:MAG: pseudouridine-5-phosphate glycosidase, partial [Planctomycetaceae bacterium]|nr:pseudouridine-5-phosphate glycosidase [Planctomycetaceae bacterium]